MALNKKPYKGTRDFFPKEKRALEYVFEKMRTTALSFGYEPYDGPLLEEVELYKAKSGEELINDQIYSFTDRGERFVAIRPEMTPTLARMVAQIHREVSKPIRYFSIPNLMRYEAPQKGRLREHWQFNCDVFGAPSPSAEVEIVQLIVHLLRSFGATSEQFEILINDRTIVDAIFSKMMNLPPEKAHRLYKIIDRSKKLPQEATNKLISDQELTKEQETLFKHYLSLQNFEEVITFVEEKGELETIKTFKQFYEMIKRLSLETFVKFDPTIVRGLDYYTGIVFEAFDKHPENRRAICGGGAYANLLKIFDEPALQGIGFGLGDVTLTDFLVTHNLMPDFTLPSNDLLVSFQETEGQEVAMSLAEMLREQGLRVVCDLEVSKMKKVFPSAEKKGANFVALLGANELAQAKVEIKNLKTKEQHAFLLQDIEAITRYLRS